MFRFLAPLAVLIALAAPAYGDTGFARLAEKIRRAEEREPGIPTDLSLYAPTVTYGHSTGKPRMSAAAKLLSVIGTEQDSFKRFVADRRTKLLHFIAGKDAIVAVTEMSGVLPDRTPFDTKTAIFFFVEDGRVARMELWGDPILGAKFETYMAKDPEVAAVRRHGR